MRRVIYLLILAGLVGGGAYYWVYVRSPALALAAAGRRPPDSIPVAVAVAEARDVAIYLDGLGTVQASALVTVKPQVDGKLIEVAFKEGQDVKAGDVLARIDPRTYQAALDQAVAKKRQDEALLANGRVDLARYQKLAASAYTSAQQSDTQKALVAQQEAVVAQDQAQIDTARTNLSYTTVTAPVDGRLGIRQVDAGNIVHAADVAGLVVVTTLSPISVVFTLPQQSLGAVAVFNTADGDVVAAVRKMTHDRGVDTAIEAVGRPETFTICERVIGPGGTLANVGVHGTSVALHLEHLWDRNISITTRLVDTVSTPVLMEVLAANRLQPKKLITHRFPLAQAVEAYETFSTAAETHALKVLISA